MKHDHIDDHEYFLGRLVASFQSLELALVEYFAGLVSWEDRDIGYIVSDGLPFKRLITTVDALAKHKEQPDQYATLKPMLEACGKLEEERNRYVHGYWDIASVDGRRISWVWFKRRNRFGKGNVHTEEKLTPDLDDFVHRSGEVTQAIRLRIRKPSAGK